MEKNARKFLAARARGKTPGAFHDCAEMQNAFVGSPPPEFWRARPEIRDQGPLKLYSKSINLINLINLRGPLKLIKLIKFGWAAAAAWAPGSGSGRGRGPVLN